MADELFDLVWQIMAVAQTMMYSSEEEQRLETLHEWEDQLMIRAEHLQKKIAKAQQVISTLEFGAQGSMWEASEKGEQHQTLGWEKASSSPT